MESEQDSHSSELHFRFVFLNKDFFFFPKVKVFEEDFQFLPTIFLRSLMLCKSKNVVFLSIQLFTFILASLFKFSFQNQKSF